MKISKSELYMDEIYCKMWDCPECDNSIIIGYKYCPWCWKEIEWIK